MTLEHALGLIVTLSVILIVSSLVYRVISRMP